MLQGPHHTLDDCLMVARAIVRHIIDAMCGVGGMPDLLLWHAGRRQAKLSEVKGPRDRLSEQQRAWILAIAAAGMRVEVLKVKEPK